MDKYEVGTRLYGYSKDYIRALTCEISKEFDLNQEVRIAPPHLTFLRPFYVEDENKLINNFEDVLSNMKNNLLYKINGFGIFDNKEKVFYGKIQRNPEIESLIGDLEESLLGNIEFVYPKISLPGENDINLHCSIISKGANAISSSIENFLESQKFLEITHPLLRVYLLKNNLLLREYDFPLGKSLSRWDAKNPFVFRKTEEAFENKTGYILNKDGIMLPVPRKINL